jgi:signal transduction histidine kinase
MVLISGYFVTSLFFINRTSASGEQVDIYASITEQADEILITAYRMEASAQSYLMTHNQDFHQHFKSHRCAFGHSFEELHKHCEERDLAMDHIAILERLVERRKSEIDQRIQSDSLEITPQHIHLSAAIELGSETMDSITEVLRDIRSISAKIRDENKADINVSVRNTLFMLSVFGIVMIAIVIISFNKMKTEILANEAKAKEIQEINRELSSVNENLENFAYVASHDLNEPLRKIRTFGELIKEEYRGEQPDSAMIGSHIERMQLASERMQQLIEDLLSYSRVTRNYDETQVIDLNETLANTLSDLQVVIQENQAKITIENLPKVIQADNVQMRQLFQNLISNAIKFSPNNRQPEVHISATRISAEAAAKEGHDLPNFSYYWKIEVKDNGIGFENKYADTIFAVFKRLHGRSDYEGTGIGLSICKKIIEQHKGYIKANGEPGKGSCFTLLLPATVNE